MQQGLLRSEIISIIFLIALLFLTQTALSVPTCPRGSTLRVTQSPPTPPVIATFDPFAVAISAQIRPAPEPIYECIEDEPGPDLVTFGLCIHLCGESLTCRGVCANWNAGSTEEFLQQAAAEGLLNQVLTPDLNTHDAFFTDGIEALLVNGNFDPATPGCVPPRLQDLPDYNHCVDNCSLIRPRPKCQQHCAQSFQPVVNGLCQ